MTIFSLLVGVILIFKLNENEKSCCHDLRE